MRRHLARSPAGPTVTAGRSGQSGGQSDRRTSNRALCCECGELRTVARSFRGRPPADAAIRRAVGPWCSWLRCAHCGSTTLHAVIADVLADKWTGDGCDRERHDRIVDRDRRRITRRLDALAAEGVTILRASSAEHMNLDNSLVEVIEYADGRGFVLRVCTSATPSRVLQAVELSEDLLDSPDHLGPWADDATGLWRGLAITDP
jgi:hypothetical protein